MNITVLGAAREVAHAETAEHLDPVARGQPRHVVVRVGRVLEQVQHGQAARQHAEGRVLGDGEELEERPERLRGEQPMAVSGRVLHGDLFTRGTNCNSACPYLLLGATSREVAPDALLAVHSAKVVVHFRGGQPSAEVRAAANQRGRERADRMLSAYIARMGADAGLFDLVRSIRFENMHVLTREEIVRFGIDRREIAETPWKFENSVRGMVSKAAAVREEGGKSWRLSQWRIVCASNEQFELNFQRPALAAGATAAVAISGLGPTPRHFNSPPVKLHGFEIWGLRLTHASVQGLTSAPQFEFTESVQAADGRRLARAAKFSTEGLAVALTTLVATCPPPKNMVLRQSVGAHESAAK